jgi:mono/diheme cytochrome c family protein
MRVTVQLQECPLAPGGPLPARVLAATRMSRLAAPRERLTPSLHATTVGMSRAGRLSCIVALLSLACGADTSWLYPSPASASASAPAAQLPPVEPSVEPPADPFGALPEPSFDLASCPDHPELGWCWTVTSRPEPRAARAELFRAAALDVLVAHCGQCHSSLAAPDFANPGVDDLRGLVDAGTIVPRNAAASPLYQRSAAGDMPPAGSGVVPLEQSDLDLLALFIDTPYFWPQLEAAGCEAAVSSVGFDGVFRAVTADLAQASPADQPFYRYVSLGDRASAACAEAELEGDRRALSESLNLLSLSPSLHLPSAIDAAGHLYRIDLRDFDWARPLDVDAASFRDVWEAIAARSPYSVELTGEDAAQAKLATGTAFPVLFADHVLDQLLDADLYAAVLGFGPKVTFDDFLQRTFGDVPDDDDVEAGLVRRAGTTRSRVTIGDRVAERRANGTGVLWQSLDFTDIRNSSVFEDPFDLGWADQRQALFSLPNGLLAFATLDRSDKFVAEAALQFDQRQPLPARTPVACLGCHASGPIPVVDQIRAAAIENARDLGLDREELALVKQIYPEPAAFRELVAEDSRSYQQALRQLQLPGTGSDPVAAAWLRFGTPLSLRTAAAELGVPADRLAASLPALPAALSLLEGGTLSREAFAGVYVASLCVLSESLANCPDAAACEHAIAALQGR